MSDIVVNFLIEHWYLVFSLLIPVIYFRCCIGWHSWQLNGSTERDGIYTNYYHCKYCDKTDSKSDWG